MRLIRLLAGMMWRLFQPRMKSSIKWNINMQRKMVIRLTLLFTSLNLN